LIFFKKKKIGVWRATNHALFKPNIELGAGTNYVAFPLPSHFAQVKSKPHSLPFFP